MNTFYSLLLVFLGGGLGSVGRCLLSMALKKHQVLLWGLPIHTLMANCVGCLLIGVLMGYLSRNPSQWLQMLFVVGLCGGFTTFSTFSYEVLELFKVGHATMALSYVLLSVILCVVLVTLGFLLGRM